MADAELVDGSDGHLEMTEEEIEAEEAARRMKEAAYKQTAKKLKGKDLNTLLAAIKTCESHDFLLSGGCLVPLVDLLKKPKAKWAKKNYHNVISSASETLLSFLLCEPEPEPEPKVKQDPAPTLDADGNEVPAAAPTPPPPKPPPRHPNTAFILSEMAKKKKQCKIKGVDKFQLGLVHKDVGIQLNSLRCIKALIDAAMAIDSVTKVPKGKKQVLLDLPLAKEKKAIVKKLSTGTVKNLSKLLITLVGRFEKESGSDASPPAQAAATDPETETPLVPPLPTTNEAIAVTLDCIQFCIDKNGATSMKNMIKNNGPSALLKLLAQPNHLQASLALLLKVSSYGEAGAKSMTFASGVDLLQQIISTVSDQISDAATADASAIPSLLKTLNSLLSLLFCLTSFIVENPTAKLKLDSEEETTTIPSLEVTVAATLTLNKILSLKNLAAICAHQTLYASSQILTTKSLGNIGRFSEECRAAICQNGSLPLILELLSTPKKIFDSEVTEGDQKKNEKEKGGKKDKNDKKKKADLSAPPVIVPPLETPREGDPVGYDVRRTADKALAHLVVTFSSVADTAILTASPPEEAAAASAEDATTALISTTSLTEAMGSADRDIAARAIRLAYLLCTKNTENVLTLGIAVLPPLMTALRWNLDAANGTLDGGGPLPGPTDETKVTTHELTIFISEILTSLATCDAESCVAIGTELNLALLSVPLDTKAQELAKGLNPKDAFYETTLSNPAFTVSWDLAPVDPEEPLPSMFVSSSIASALTAICDGEKNHAVANSTVNADADADESQAADNASTVTGTSPGLPGAILAVKTATPFVLSLLSNTISSVGNPTTRRALWGSTKKKHRMPQNIQISLFRFMRSASLVTGGRAALVGSAFDSQWRPGIFPKSPPPAVETAVEEDSAKKGGKKKKEVAKKKKKKKKADEDDSVAAWEPPSEFVQFGDLVKRPSDQRTLEEKEAAWPYVYVLSLVLAPIVQNKHQKSSILLESILTLRSMISEEGADQGEQQVITDVMAGIAASMGGLTGLSSLVDCNAFRHEKESRPEEMIAQANFLASYLSSRGRDREKYWAEKPIVVEKNIEEQVPAPSKPKKGGKKAKEQEPEPEVVEQAQPAEPQFGVPDPNNGPTRDSWMDLLNVASLDALNDMENSSPLHTSLVTQNFDLTASLLDSGADPNCTTTTAMTPLMYAIAQNNKDVASILIEHGANMDAIGPKGATALKFSFCVPSEGDLLKSVSGVLNPENETSDQLIVNETPKIVIMGAPASGKGTQCEQIKESFGVVHLSTGDMLRAEVEKMSDIGIEAKSYQENGEMVPDNVIIEMVEQRLAEDDCVERGWLLDGFPRTAAQADALEKMPNGKADVVVMLDVEDKNLVDRVIGRRRDPETGKIYHIVTNPPESDEIAARLEQRSDDNEETVKVRLENYHKNVDAVLSVYQGTYVAPDPLNDTALYASDEGYTTGYTTGNDTAADLTENDDIDLSKTVDIKKEEEVRVAEEAANAAIPNEAVPEVAIQEEKKEVDDADAAALNVQEKDRQRDSFDMTDMGDALLAEVEEEASPKIAAVTEADNSRIFHIDGNRAPEEIVGDVYGVIVKVTNWQGIPKEEEVELGNAALKIQGVFRTREAKKRVAVIKEDNGIDAFTHLKKACNVPGLPLLVQFLIDKGADVNISDDDGNFPLHWALSGATVEFQHRSVNVLLKGPVKDEKLLDILASSGADMDVCNKKGETLLHTALNSGDTPAALRLLDAGAHPNAMDADGLLPIHHACMSASPGFDELVEVLLTSGDGRGIMVATHKDPRKGKSGKEKLLLTLEGIIDNCQAEAMCPASITQRLVDKKEILQLVTNDGFTALHYAAGAAGDSDGDLDIPSRVSLLKRLLADDAVDINVADINPPGAGATALHCTINMLGELDIVKVLVANGIDLNALEDVGDNSGFFFSALHYALKRKKNDICEYLLEEGAAPILSGCNPPILNWAVECGVGEELIGLLMLKASGLDPQFVNITDSNGKSCLHIGVECGNAVAVAVILNAPNVVVDAKDAAGRTALHCAILKNDAESVKLLLAKGASVHEVDGDGVSTLELAVDNVGSETLTILEEVLSSCSVDDIVKVGVAAKVSGAAGSSILERVESNNIGYGEKKKEEEDSGERGENAVTFSENVVDNEMDSEELSLSSLEVGLDAPSVPLTPSRRAEAAVDLHEMSCNVVKLLLKFCDGKIPEDAHVHDCFKEGSVYYDWLLKQEEEERLAAARAEEERLRLKELEKKAKRRKGKKSK